MMQDMRPSGGGKVRLTFTMPSRGLIGYHNEFLTDTRRHRHHEPAVRRLSALGRIDRRPGEGFADLVPRNGAAVQYSLFSLQERGQLFVDPGEKVYIGMILGEHSRENDLEVNPIREKKLTNIRAAGKDEALLLVPPRRMSLEQAIAYIEDDELVEVTPSAIRIRKALPQPERAQEDGEARRQRGLSFRYNAVAVRQQGVRAFGPGTPFFLPKPFVLNTLSSLFARSIRSCHKYAMICHRGSSVLCCISGGCIRKLPRITEL